MSLAYTLRYEKIYHISGSNFSLRVPIASIDHFDLVFTKVIFILFRYLHTRAYIFWFDGKYRLDFGPEVSWTGHEGQNPF